MHKSLAVGIATATNMVLISSPLITADVKLLAYFGSPVTWLFYLLVTSFCLLEGSISSAASIRRLSSIELPSLPYLMGFIVLLVFWVSVYEFASSIQSNVAATSFGSILVAAGISFRVLSIKALRSYFTSHIGLIDNHVLIRQGVYSIIRHPSEAGLLLVCFGVSTLFSSIAGVLLTVFFLLPLSLLRVSIEDRIMLARFADEFAMYRASTPAMVPSLYSVRKLRSRL